MPEKETLQRAQEAKREGKRPTSQAGEFIHPGGVISAAASTAPGRRSRRSRSDSARRWSKLPDLDAPLARRLALDTLYSLLADADFEQEQVAIDAAVVPERAARGVTGPFTDARPRHAARPDAGRHRSPVAADRPDHREGQ